METIDSIKPTVKKKYSLSHSFLAQLLLGGFFTLACSLIRIPLSPVPFTLQTFSIAVLGLTLTPKRAFLTTLFFLFLYSFIYTDWMLGLRAGYLIAMPFAGYVIAFFREKKREMTGLFIGQLLIYSLGCPILIPLFGLKYALIRGVGLFILTDLLKNLAALFLVTRSQKGRKITQQTS